MVRLSARYSLPLMSLYGTWSLRTEKKIFWFSINLFFKDKAIYVVLSMCDLELYFHIKYSITASEICDYSRLYFFILLDQSLFVYFPCDVNTKKLVFCVSQLRMRLPQPAGLLNNLCLKTNSFVSLKW